MTTNTTPAFPPARVDPRQVSNTLKKTVNFNDPGITTGVAFANSLPANAFILGVYVEIVVVFNAGTTNVLTVGTNTPTNNNLVAAADVNEAATGVTLVTANAGDRGRSLTAAGDIPVYVMYTQTGTAATTGQAIIVIEYEGGISPS